VICRGTEIGPRYFQKDLFFRDDLKALDFNLRIQDNVVVAFVRVSPDSSPKQNRHAFSVIFENLEFGGTTTVGRDYLPDKILEAQAHQVNCCSIHLVFWFNAQEAIFHYALTDEKEAKKLKQFWNTEEGRKELTLNEKQTDGSIIMKYHSK